MKTIRRTPAGWELIESRPRSHSASLWLVVALMWFAAIVDLMVR